MSSAPISPAAVTRTIEGITALCLGSAERLVWVDEPDAAAFSDGEHMYLPRPVGAHAGEFELLLALALREVARLWHSDAQAFQRIEDRPRVYAALIEEVRLETELARTFLGAPAIFSRAARTALKLRLDALEVEQSSSNAVNTVLVWATAHAPTPGCEDLEPSLNRLHALAQRHTAADRLDKAVSMAQRASRSNSSQAAAKLGAQIAALLATEVPPIPEDAAAPHFHLTAWPYRRIILSTIHSFIPQGATMPGSLRIRDPRFEKAVKRASVQPTLDSLAGKTLAILNNGWTSMDAMAAHLTEALKRRYGVANVISFSVPVANPAAPAILAEAASRADFAAVGLAN